MKPGPAQDPSPMDAAARGFGLPPFNRRLSGKDLAAFDHAGAARERHHTVKHDPRFDGAAVGEALAEMKEAFESWSLG